MSFFICYSLAVVKCVTCCEYCRSVWLQLCWVHCANTNMSSLMSIRRKPAPHSRLLLSR